MEQTLAMAKNNYNRKKNNNINNVQQVQQSRIEPNDNFNTKYSTSLKQKYAQISDSCRNIRSMG